MPKHLQSRVAASFTVRERRYMFFAVGISRNQYDSGWRLPWRIDLQILKICININALRILMAETQGVWFPPDPSTFR